MNAADLDHLPIAQLPIAELPDDPQLLKALLVRHAEVIQKLQRLELEHAAQAVAQDEKIQKLQHRQSELELDKLRLQHRLEGLLKRQYGPRADKLGTAQLLFDFGQALETLSVDAAAAVLDAAATATETQGQKMPSKRHGTRGRRNLATIEGLPVIPIEYDLPESEKPCPKCHRMRQQIGSEGSQYVERIPEHFVRVQIKQLKYCCRNCEQQAAETGPQIVVADKPYAPIEKGLPGPGLLAYIIVGKFMDHLPLYRLEQIFSRHGMELGRSAMCQWMTAMAELLKPLWLMMAVLVREGQVLGTDDTVLPMLRPGQVQKARIWIYRGDDHHPYNVFDFTTSRSRDGPAKFLDKFKGVLLADAYGGYAGICIQGNNAKAACWSHVRRKFTDCQSVDPARCRAAVELINELFAIEREAKGLPLDQVLAVRKAKSAPVLETLHARLLVWKTAWHPKHPFIEAVKYALNQWDDLKTFLEHPYVAIDNNLAEQEMKRMAVGRKNWLFVGNERGGENAAILASFTSTCRRLDINPQEYLTQLLANLPSTPISELRQWLPDVWKKAQAAAGSGAGATAAGDATPGGDGVKPVVSATVPPGAGPATALPAAGGKPARVPPVAATVRLANGAGPARIVTPSAEAKRAAATRFVLATIAKTAVATTAAK